MALAEHESGPLTALSRVVAKERHAHVAQAEEVVVAVDLAALLLQGLGQGVAGPPGRRAGEQESERGVSKPFAMDTAHGSSSRACTVAASRGSQRMRIWKEKPRSPCSASPWGEEVRDGPAKRAAHRCKGEKGEGGTAVLCAAEPHSEAAPQVGGQQLVLQVHQAQVQHPQRTLAGLHNEGNRHREGRGIELGGLSQAGCRKGKGTAEQGFSLL